MPSSIDKLAVFIDGVQSTCSVEDTRFRDRLQAPLKEYESRSNLVRAYYYTVMIGDREYSSIRPLIDWLDYNGYTVVSNPAKEFDDGEGRRKIKRSMSVEIAVSALGLSNHIDHVYFPATETSGPLWQRCERRGYPRYCGLTPVDDF